MKIQNIINKLSKSKQNNDYEEFKKIFESLNLDELIHLQTFATELKDSCDKEISNHKFFKIINKK
jgi:hypothetical protein